MDSHNPKNIRDAWLCAKREVLLLVVCSAQTGIGLALLYVSLRMPESGYAKAGFVNLGMGIANSIASYARLASIIKNKLQL